MGHWGGESIKDFGGNVAQLTSASLGDQSLHQVSAPVVGGL